MRYFSEQDRIKKENWLRKHGSLLRNLYRKTNTVHDYYDEQLGPLMGEKTVLLDAGCGEKGIMDKYRGKNCLSVGMDLSLEAMACNSALDGYVQSGVEVLPFKDKIFDVVVSQWVMEHIRSPRLVFKEFSRVLKPDGDLIVVTNSVYNPIMLVSAVLPSRMRDNMKEKVFPSEIKEDTFPTYYNCNSKRKFESILSELGFVRRFSGYSGDISIFLFSRFLFALALFYEKITDLPWLNCFKMHIVVHYKKKGTAEAFPG